MAWYLSGMAIVLTLIAALWIAKRRRAPSGFPDWGMFPRSTYPTPACARPELPL